MKTCPRCNTQLADDAVFCTGCGAPVSAGAPETPIPQNPMGAPNPMPSYQPMYDPYDHTAEFDPKDISDNKVFAMSVYLLGWIGIVISLLAANKSDYAGFHVRQALKFTVVQTLMPLIAILGAITVIIPIAVGIMNIVLFVVEIICFFQVCGGKAKEPAIIRSLGFLR